MMQSADILASGGEDYEKNIFCFSSIDGDSHNRHKMQIEKHPQDS